MLASITVDGLAGHHSSFCRMRGGGDDSNPPTVTPPTSVVQPLPLPGLYAVACSYIQQNFGSLTSDEVKRYWEGDGGLYVTALLVDRANTLIAEVTAPWDEDLFGSFAGQKKQFVALVCYPTTGSNPYPDYSLPSRSKNNLHPRQTWTLCTTSYDQYFLDIQFHCCLNFSVITYPKYQR